MEDNSTRTKRLHDPNSLMLKSRYRFDDFDFTPSPPGVDDEFLHLRFHSDFNQIENKETRLSVFDSINQELGISTETGARKLSVTKADRRLSISGSPSLHISSSGISLSTLGDERNEDIKKDESSSSKSRKIILDPSIARNRGIASHDTSTIQASCLDPSTHFPLDSSNALDHTISVRKTIENISLIKDKYGARGSQGNLSTITQSSLSPATSVADVNDTIPAQSLNPVDKVMDRNTTVAKSHIANYFFTGGMFSSSDKSPSYTSVSGPTSLGDNDKQVATLQGVKSSPPSPLHHFGERGTKSSFNDLQRQTMKIEEGEKVGASFDEKGKVSGRRPKPSTLREMNFWAPQSM